MYICTLSGMFEEMVERGKEVQSVQHILINMGKDNNSRTENNMYICTLSGMFEDMFIYILHTSILYIRNVITQSYDCLIYTPIIDIIIIL